MIPKVCQFPSKYIYTPFMGVSDLVKQPDANGKQKTYLYCMLHLEAFWPLIYTRWLFQHSWFLKICLPNISNKWGAQSAWLGRPNYKEISKKEVNHMETKLKTSERVNVTCKLILPVLPNISSEWRTKQANLTSILQNLEQGSQSLTIFA